MAEAADAPGEGRQLNRRDRMAIILERDGGQRRPYVASQLRRLDVEA